MSTSEILIVIFVVFGVTFALRAFPFIIFSKHEPPKLVRYIGEVISPAAIAMLVVYCFKDMQVDAAHCYGLAEVTASVVVIGLQWRFKNPLLAIIAGTALYMYLLA